jgi:hypothetical protein
MEIMNKWDCLNAGASWENQISHFDDVLSAFLSVFHMSTTAGWAEVMYNGLNSRGIDL